MRTKDCKEGGQLRRGEKEKRQHTAGLLFLIPCMLLLEIGCASYMGQYDSSVPLSEQARLKIPGELTVIKFDGKPVSWGLPRGARLGGYLYIDIPAGKHDLMFNYLDISSHGLGRRAYITTTSSAYGMIVSTEFTAGHTYQAYPVDWGGTIASVQIKDIKSGMAKESQSNPEVQTDAGLDEVRATEDNGVRVDADER